jgi:hypothetical protein
MNYAFDSGIRVGLRATYYSGRPDVPTFVFAPGAEMPSASPLLQRRLVPYYRIDLRAEKRWQVGRTEWVAAVLEFFNATLSKEAIGQTCQVSAGRSIGAASCNDEFIGPISLPSVGVEGGF